MEDIFPIALLIATQAHQGQVREDGQQYITHPQAVANSFTDDLRKSISILHDVLEDTPVTADDLLQQGISPEVVNRVKDLTRKKGESYFEFIMRLVYAAPPESREVKIADIDHNLSDAKPGSRADKYRLARFILLGSLE